jgi:uncharacterized protein
MKLQNNQLIFSATDLSGYVNCKSLTFYNKEAALGKRKKPVYSNPLTQLLIDKGLAFEDAYLEELAAEGLKILKIDKEDREATENTINGMKAGYDIIYQARVKMDSWQGWADFLLKVEGSSGLGDWSYEVLDTKLATETKAGTILQIALYSEMIAQIQEKLPEFMHIKTPESKLTYRVDDFIAYVRLIKNRFLELVKLDEEIYPDVAIHCDICNWWEECNKRRREDDHLSFIAGMSNLHIKEVRAQQVYTLAQMAVVPIPIQFNPSRGSSETYMKIREQARLQKQSREENKPVYELLLRYEGLGLYRLPNPSEWDIYLDLEGDPMIEPSGREYIIGWYYRGKYFIEWAETAEKEKSAFENFMDIAVKIKSEHPEMHIYHYGAYEPSAFKRLMCRYATKENEMDTFLRSGTFVDLHSIVKQSLRAGVEKYSLKHLEKYHGFLREMDLRKLSPVKANYEFLLQCNKPEDATDEMRSVIQLYNQDDCVSTQSLHQWLENERTLLINAGEEIPRPVMPSGEASDNITAHQQRIQPLFDALMKEIPLEVADRNASQQGKFILAHMLDWYRREKKSFWWEYFRLRELPDDELLDEKQALTSLEQTGGVEPDKRSFIYTYRFTPQDCELKRGDKLKDRNDGSAGELISINLKNQMVRIKKGPSIKDYHPTSVYCLDDFPATDKEESIIRIAKWVCLNGIDSEAAAFKCGRDLLLRSFPNTVEPFLNADNDVHTAIQWSLNLDHSILPIQGPPGTGKSYTASKMILELIRQDKKIGVTALSHKVITNLLQKVYDQAKEEGLSIKILQKTSEEGLNWDTTNAPKDIDAAIENYDLIAGTSFLWCREALVDTLDYLFVDEAGQLSLIDTLAVSPAAKNLILLGDPQQLKQPQQGVHPDGTEVSALEHVLQNQETINNHQGIFLSKTYRMHPEICAFNSEMFYASKLSSVANLENQRIEGKTNFAGSGLFLKPVMHNGNTSRSIEEVEVIEKIVRELCDGTKTWVDKDNKKSILTEDHIRIIAPYNAQVHELSDRLPGMQIGTVDKFQGQEAPVVIFSMTTSTPEDAPRGMDFLYSPNRFNVAVSRARAVFILVANPALLEAECKSPAQMKLANAFCRYWEVAKT